jgi:hypothetical protein
LRDAKTEKVRRKLDMGVETLYKISNDGIVMRDKQMYVP